MKRAVAAVAVVFVTGCQKPATTASTSQAAAPAILASPQATPAAAPIPVRGNAVETEVQLEPVGGTYEVPVSINDAIVLKFTIDSGAADVVLPADVVLTLARSGTITQDDFIGQQTFTLADGSTVPSTEFRIRTLKVGTLVLHNVTGTVADVRGTLLLGQSFLSRLSNWSIDNNRHALLLKAAPGEAQAVSSAAAAKLVAAEVPQITALPTEEGLSDMQQTATGRAADYFAAWSNSSDPDGIGIRAYYAPVVRFYGKNVGVDALMSEKVAFARRWPSRTYVPRSHSLYVQCSDARICMVSGVVDWRAANPVSGRQSAGVATFAMELRDGLIDSETSSVVSRQP